MSDRSAFIAGAGRIHLHDPAAYQAYLKQSALHNSYAKDVYQKQLHADQNVNDNQALTQDLYIQANDHAAHTLDKFADIVTFGAHHNLQEAARKAGDGNVFGAGRELREAGCNILVAGVAYGNGLKLLPFVK